MSSEKEEETQKLTYDDRRKELIQEKSQITENKTDVPADSKEEPKLISTVDQKMKVVYSEDGIKLAYKNLSSQRTAMEKRIADLKEQVDKIEEIPEDLKKLQEDLKTIANFANAEKAKLEYENIQAELKIVNKEITEIKTAIGDRLKL